MVSIASILFFHFPYDFPWSLVFPQTLKRWMPQYPFIGPFRERHFAHQRGPRPMRRPDTRRPLPERAIGLLKLFQLRRQLNQCFLVIARPHLAREKQFTLGIIIANQQSAKADSCG